MASLTCPNCQAVAAEGTGTCPSCGNPLPSVASAGPVGPAQASGFAPPPPPGTAAPRPQIKFDLAAVSHVDRLVGGGTLVLFISLFLPWFNANLGIVTVSASGLSVHGFLYITLILSLFIIGFVVAETLGLWKLPAASALSRDQILLGATGINLILVLIAFLDKPGGHGVGWDWGSFVGLIAAVVAVSPLGWPLIQARRNK
jgi:hypothetical protein